jgi:hypothetical protein
MSIFDTGYEAGKRFGNLPLKLFANRGDVWTVFGNAKTIREFANGLDIPLGALIGWGFNGETCRKDCIEQDLLERIYSISTTVRLVARKTRNTRTTISQAGSVVNPHFFPPATRCGLVATIPAGILFGVFMTAPLREQFANDASDILDGGIDNSQTTIDVIDGSEFPAAGNFRLKIEDELMLCTARSGNTLMVARGIEGTSAASHSDAKTVSQILTLGSVQRWGQDNYDLWNSTRPPLGLLVADDGSTLLTSGDFTGTNTTNATLTDEFGTIAVDKGTQSGLSPTLWHRAAPSAPYSYIAAFRFLGFQNNSQPSIGMVLRKNSAAQNYLLSVGCRASSNPFAAVRKDNSGSFTALVGVANFYFVGEVIWMKIEDDNTDVKFYLSCDGVKWVQIASEARTTLMSGGPDRVGFFIDNDNSSGVHAQGRLVHWSRAS